MLISHKTTFEITKDKYVSLNGDCIVACGADFDVREVKEFIKNCDRIKIIFSVDGNILESIEATLNKDFNDDKEIVFRLSNYLSERTLGIRASKSAIFFSKEYKVLMKEGKKVKITFEAL